MMDKEKWKKKPLRRHFLSGPKWIVDGWAIEDFITIYFM